MKWLLLLCQLLITSAQTSAPCPLHCSCYGGLVDCSSRSLSPSSLPTSFPSGTKQLRLHNNHLTTLPNGLLDHLPDLESVTLYGNPWVCDCGVLYLRAWLLRLPHTHMSHLGVNCSSPAILRGRLVAYLTEEEVLGSCHHWYCDLAVASLICLLLFVLVQGLLLIAIIIFLKRFERMSKEARRIREESLTGAGLTVNENFALKDSGI